MSVKQGSEPRRERDKSVEKKRVWFMENGLKIGEIGTEREGDRRRRGLLVDQSIGFSASGVTHPALTGRLRPFERWPPVDRPIRFREVARAEKARANAPFVWPPRRRTSTRSGFILFLLFLLNFNPPPSLSHALLPFYDPVPLPRSDPSNCEKNFSRSQIPLRVPSRRPSLFLPFGTPRLFFPPHENSTRETRASSFPVA